MKRTIKLLLTILGCVLLCAVVVDAFFYTRMPKGSAEVSGTIVDNDYNNYLAGGDLVRIGDKLYYNYCRNE